MGVCDWTHRHIGIRVTQSLNPQSQTNISPNPSQDEPDLIQELKSGNRALVDFLSTQSTELMEHVVGHRDPSNALETDHRNVASEVVCCDVAAITMSILYNSDLLCMFFGLLHQREIDTKVAGYFHKVLATLVGRNADLVLCHCTYGKAQAEEAKTLTSVPSKQAMVVEDEERDSSSSSSSSFGVDGDVEEEDLGVGKVVVEEEVKITPSAWVGEKQQVSRKRKQGEREGEEEEEGVEKAEEGVENAEKGSVEKEEETKEVKEEAWKCSACMTSNQVDALVCVVCEAYKEGEDEVDEEKTTKQAPIPPPRPTPTWKCLHCTTSNPIPSTQCRVCEAEQTTNIVHLFIKHLDSYSIASSFMLLSAMAVDEEEDNYVKELWTGGHGTANDILQAMANGDVDTQFNAAEVLGSLMDCCTQSNDWSSDLASFLMAHLDSDANVQVLTHIAKAFAKAQEHETVCLFCGATNVDEVCSKCGVDMCPLEMLNIVDNLPSLLSLLDVDTQDTALGMHRLHVVELLCAVIVSGYATVASKGT